MTEHPEVAVTRNRRTLLHVTECSTGGVTRALALAIAATPDINHVVLSPTRTTQLRERHVKHVPLPDGALARIRAVRRVAEEVGADAIHAHSSLAGAYARIGKPRAPVLYQPHCYAFADVTKPHVLRAVYWLAERLMSRRTAAVLALTPHEERQARRLGLRTVHQIVNAPTVTHRLVTKESDANRATKKIVMVGRVAPQKDPRFFAEVANEFRLDPTVQFFWLGAAPENDAHSDGIAALERAGVEVTGWLSDRELVQQLADADLYLHSAAYEGFPLSLLDACELGVPCIVREIPALAETKLPSFANAREAAALVASLLTDARALATTQAATQALRNRMGLVAHDESISRAYARHGLLDVGVGGY